MFYMREYVKDIIDKAPEDMDGKAMRPATSLLIGTDNHNKFLSNQGD